MDTSSRLIPSPIVHRVSTLPLPRPTNPDLQVYFDNTPSGPYRQRPGQHIWTDGKIETPDAQLMGAGVAGYMPAFAVHYFR
eukprot:10416-Rhodomonas_salina.1